MAGPFATPKHKPKVPPAATNHKPSSHVDGLHHGNLLKSSTLQAKEDQPKAATRHTEPKDVGNVDAAKDDSSVPHGGHQQKPSPLPVTEDQPNATTPSHQGSGIFLSRRNMV